VNPLLSALVAAGIITQADAERINRSMDADAMRAWAEQQMAVAVQGGLSAQQTRLVDMVRRTNGSLSQATLADFWRQEDERLYAALRGTLEGVASESAIAMSVRMGGDDSMWRVVNERVLAWIDGYYINADAAAVGSIPNLNLTSRTEFARAFAEWQRGELELGTRLQGLPQLIEALTPTFGPQRAAIIAATESTRIQVESERRAGEADEDTTHWRYYTAADERVCPQCGPLHGRIVAKTSSGFDVPQGGRQYPPIHPNCRCRILPESSETLRQPLPPEERYQWSAEEYAASQRDIRQAQRRPSALDVLTGG
jgi:SPP1 gp7 family putative phage head morphogenesis protein